MWSLHQTFTWLSFQKDRRKERGGWHHSSHSFALLTSHIHFFFLKFLKFWPCISEHILVAAAVQQNFRRAGEVMPTYLPCAQMQSIYSNAYLLFNIYSAIKWQETEVWIWRRQEGNCLWNMHEYTHAAVLTCTAALGGNNGRLSRGRGKSGKETNDH